MPPRVQRKHSVVLVIGMRRRVHEGADRGQPPQRKAETHLPLRVRQRLDDELRRTLLRSRTERQRRHGKREQRRAQAESVTHL